MTIIITMTTVTMATMMTVATMRKLEVVHKEVEGCPNGELLSHQGKYRAARAAKKA